MIHLYLEISKISNLESFNNFRTIVKQVFLQFVSILFEDFVIAINISVSGCLGMRDNLQIKRILANAGVS